MKKVLLTVITLLPAVLLTSCNDGKHIYDWHKTLALIIIISIILMFLGLAIYSNMLRDEVNDSDTFNLNAEKIKQRRGLRFIKSTNPFSLSRTQLGIWTVVISCSYIYLQLCMGNCTDTSLNTTALVLMGISAGVTAGGVMIDKREIQDGRCRHQNSPSEGFLIDILSDEDGISVHRFQKVIWTSVAIIIYLNKVYSITTGCALPELSQTLLWLTGISSAAYLTLKTQENYPTVFSPTASMAPIDNPAGNATTTSATTTDPVVTPGQQTLTTQSVPAQNTDTNNTTQTTESGN